MSIFESLPINALAAWFTASRAKRKLIAVFALLGIGNLLAWGCALMLFHDQPLLLGTALLAYGFGLRHAVDADHIAAIDNVTRNLMEEGKRPVGVGLFFSLGHSTVVLLACVTLVLTMNASHGWLATFASWGRPIGTSISAFFLFAIAASNALLLITTWRKLAHARLHNLECTEMHLRPSLLGRLCRPLFRLIGSSWQMYPLGVLFGLGFDTATEVGILAISAVQISIGLPFWSVLLFPILFTAGMTLVDTADSALMLGAYGWALREPVRKLRYNVTITMMSVCIAIVIGGVEISQLLIDKLGVHGRFIQGVAQVNEQMAPIGYLVITFFTVCWLAAVLWHYFRPRKCELMS